jgi:hypothetical protein
MRAKAIVAVCAVTLVAALVPPAGALAAHRERFTRQASVTGELRARGTHGFRFVLFALDRHTNIISVTKRVSRAGEENVNYFALSPGQHENFDPDHLDVKVGRLGHFRGHFVATSTKIQKNPLERCEGEPTTIEKGFFVGSFSFRGERGYTSIHAHRERGAITRQGRASCILNAEFADGKTPRQAKEEREREEGAVRLVAGNAKAHLLLQASQEQAPRGLGTGPSTFFATVDGGKVGRFSVSRSVAVVDFTHATATFLTPNATEPLTEATLAPPAPFSGSATFHLEGPNAASWTGDLAVELPGLGTVPLTGEGIDAGLCKGRSHCTETLPRELQRLLESGGEGSFTGGFVEIQTIR